MTLSVPLICGYGSGSAGRSWTCRAVRSLGTGSSHLSLGYRLLNGGVLWRTVLDGDALPLAQMTQIVKVCATNSNTHILIHTHTNPHHLHIVNSCALTQLSSLSARTQQAIVFLCLLQPYRYINSRNRHFTTHTEKHENKKEWYAQYLFSLKCVIKLLLHEVLGQVQFHVISILQQCLYTCPFFLLYIYENTREKKKEACKPSTNAGTSQVYKLHTKI